MPAVLEIEAGPDPAQDIELPCLDRQDAHLLPPQPGFRRTSEGILAHLRIARHESDDVSAVMVDLYGDESLREYASPFNHGYESVVEEVAKAFAATPDIGPGELIARLHALQREGHESWHYMDVHSGICREVIMWGHVYALGFQCALWILDEDVVHPEDASDR
jgi:hypothetical protein